MNLQTSHTAFQIRPFLVPGSPPPAPCSLPPPGRARTDSSLRRHLEGTRQEPEVTDVLGQGRSRDHGLPGPQEHLK